MPYFQRLTDAVLSDELTEDLQRAGFVETAVPEPGRPCLLIDRQGLRLQSASGLAIQIDFRESQYQRRFAPAKDLLCRACGWPLGLRSVWDLTAGLGVEAVQLAQAGFEVRAFERNPYLAVMLRQGLRQLRQENPESSHVLSNLQFEFAESEKIFELSADALPEVLYYDPMYPGHRKTALPSKQLQVLREINGSDGESPELLAQLSRQGPRRVVIKRPHRAPPLLERPTAEMSGKLVRYDIYQNWKAR